MAKNKVRKQRVVSSTKTASGRRLSNNNTIVFTAILIAAALIGGSILFAVGSSFSGGPSSGGTTNNSASLISSYQETLKKNPNDLVTREQLGIAYYTAGADLLNQNKQQEANQQFKLAIAEFEKIAAKNPKNAPVLGDLATSYYYTGQTDKAIEVGRKALEADPNLAPARMNLGRFLASKQQYAQAIEELKKVPETYSESAQAKAMIKQYQDILASGKK